jgi:molybdenum cofactor cytidylyltransferase
MEAPDSPATGRADRRARVKIGAIILAAGSSSRLGQPKQLLEYEGRTLVRRAAEAALVAGCDPVAVVVGANLENVAAALRGLAVLIVPNEDWERGLGTSIRAGVVRLQESDAVILLVCDQPKVDAGLLRDLIARQEQTGQPMVASRYAATNGVPALFTRACFERLLALEDDSGAKALLQSRPAEVATVAFPAAAFDVDTPADFHLLGH